MIYQAIHSIIVYETPASGAFYFAKNHLQQLFIVQDYIGW